MKMEGAFKGHLLEAFARMFLFVVENISCNHFHSLTRTTKIIQQQNIHDLRYNTFLKVVKQKMPYTMNGMPLAFFGTLASPVAVVKSCFDVNFT